MREDYIGKIIENYTPEISDSDKSVIGWNYRIISIRYLTLSLSSKNSNNVLNSGIISACKSETIIYNDALEEILGYKPRFCYIIGKKYKMDDNYHHSFENIGRVDIVGYDKNLVEKTNRALEWLIDLKENGENWNILAPDRWELYPNMSNTVDYPWQKVKKYVALDS